MGDRLRSGSSRRHVNQQLAEDSLRRRGRHGLDQGTESCVHGGGDGVGGGAGDCGGGRRVAEEDDEHEEEERSRQLFGDVARDLSSRKSSRGIFGRRRQGEQHDSPLESVDQVVDWISSQGFPEYAEAFRVNEVDGDTLRTISADELREDIGVRSLKHRKDMLMAIDKLVSGMTTPICVEPLPEMGRILSLLSNIRTLQSWTICGVQLLNVSVGVLRITPVNLPLALVATSSLLVVLTGIAAIAYGSVTYSRFLVVLSRSGMNLKLMKPDVWGPVAQFVALLFLSALILLMIGWRGV